MNKSLLSFKVTDMKRIADKLTDAKSSKLYFIHNAIIEGKQVEYGCETKTIYRFLRICDDPSWGKDACYSIKAQDFVSFIKDEDMMTLHNAHYTDIIRKKILTTIDTSCEIRQVYDIMYGNKIPLTSTLDLSTKAKQRFIDTMKLATKPSRADLSMEAEITYCPLTGFVMWTNNHICVTSKNQTNKTRKTCYLVTYTSYLHTVSTTC